MDCSRCRNNLLTHRRPAQTREEIRTPTSATAHRALGLASGNNWTPGASGNSSGLFLRIETYYQRAGCGVQDGAQGRSFHNKVWALILTSGLDCTIGKRRRRFSFHLSMPLIITTITDMHLNLPGTTLISTAHLPRPLARIQGHEGPASSPFHGLGRLADQLKLHWYIPCSTLPFCPRIRVRGTMTGPR